MLFQFVQRTVYATILSVGIVMPSHADDTDLRSNEDASSALKPELLEFMESQGYAAVPASIVEDIAPGERIGGQQMLVEAYVCGASKCSTRRLLADTGSATVLLSGTAIEELDLPHVGVPPTQEPGSQEEFLVREICLQDRCVHNSRVNMSPDVETEVLEDLCFRN